MPLIIPPADIRPMIDKTAQYVARHGPSFEAMVLQREQGNPQFAFLEFSNPYRAFFDKRVTEARLNWHNSDSNLQEDLPASVPQGHKALAQAREQPEAQAEAQTEAQAEADLHPEDLSFKFAFRAPELTLEQAQILKLTAFYVAVRGDEYLDRVALRFGEDPRFAFLKTAHPHFLFFTHLVDSYAGVRQVGPADLHRWVGTVQDKMAVVERCARRLKLESEEAMEKRRLVAETNEIQNEFEFDWNNFVVVETVDFEPDQFRTGVTDARGNFAGVDPKSYLGKRGINPEFAFLAEGLKKKKEGNFGPGPVEVAGSAETPLSEPRLISFKPFASVEHNANALGRQMAKNPGFESRPKPVGHRQTEFGTMDFLAGLNKTLSGGPGDPSGGDPAELQKPKLLRR